MASSPGQLTSGKVACNSDASAERKIDTRPPKLDIFAQEKCDVPQGVEPMAEADSGVGLGMTLKNVDSAFPPAASQSCGDVKPETQVHPADLRTFLSPSLKSLSFYSPTPGASPLSAQFLLGKSNTICNGLMDKIQQHPSRTPVQAAKGGRFFFTKYMDAMESMIMAEPEPSMSFLDCTMESSCLVLKADAMNLPQIRSPQVQSRSTVTLEVEESAVKSAVGATDASVESRDMSSCFRSQQNLISNLEKEQLSKSSANVDCPSASVLNGTYNLSSCEKSSGGQDLLVPETGSIAIESGSFTKAGGIIVAAPSEVGLTAKEGSLNETSSNNTLVLHTGPSVTGLNLTVDITERSTVGPATESSVANVLRENSKDALELQSETVTQPSVTVDLCQANLRSFLSPSFKYLSFLSPIPEVSPVSAELVLSKSNSIHGNVMDEFQQYPSRTPKQALKGGKWFLPKCMDAMESMIMAEPAPSMSFLDCTMESSDLKLEGDTVNKPESGLPQLRSHVKVTPEVEESAEKSGAGSADASVECCDTNSFSSQQNLGSVNLEKQQLLKSSANVEVPSSSVLNGTYNLSNSEKSSRGQDLLVVEAGNTTVEVASVADPTANQASSNNTLVLHSGSSITGRNLTIDITDRSTVGLATEASVAQMLRENSKDTEELQSGTMARPNVTVDITDQSGFGVSLQDSAGSLGRKNGTFEIDPDSAHEPTRAPNLTVNLTTTNMSGSKTGSGTRAPNLTVNLTTTNMSGPKTGSGDLQPGQSNEPATGPKRTCGTSEQLDLEDDLTGVSEFEAGADGKLAPLTEAGNCDEDCNQNMCMGDHEGCSQMSFDTSLDMKPNFLITSTPLVAPKVFSFAAKAAPSDSCGMQSVLGRCEASSNENDGSAPPQVDQPPPASARPPTKSLAIPSSLPLKCSAMTRPSNRKTLAIPSAIPKSHHTISRPPSSLLAPPPRTLSGLQVPGTSSFLSSTQSRIGRRTGGATRNTTASNPLEASVGSTINRRRQSVSENKPPIPGLLKPSIPSQPSASSVISQLALRPSGQAKPKLLTQRAAASSASHGSSESHMKGAQLPASSAKQPRGNTEETQPLSKRKRVDTLVHPAPSQTTGLPAGNQRGIRKPASLLRAPQSRLQSLGDQTSGILATKKSAPPAPLPPDLQPSAAQTDCKNCAKYRLEIARLRAELQEKGQMNS